MKFEYTDHALEKLVERKLDKKLVEIAILKPDKITEARFSRKIAQKNIDNKLLRVVYELEYGTHIIITAYYAEKERYTRHENNL
jgi:hypothetical protein